MKVAPFATRKSIIRSQFERNWLSMDEEDEYI